MPYRIAGIDVHKKMLAVVVADIEIDGEYQFERQKFATGPAEVRTLADWLVEREVEEVVMESTAQYWRPAWDALEQHWRPRRRARDGAPCLAGTLHLAQSAIESRAWGTQEGLPGCGTAGEAPRRPRADLELCAGRRATALAHRDAPQLPGHAQPRATAESARGRCSRKRTSRCRVSSQTCWASAPATCCRRWRRVKPILPPSR
jgi:hypothetical protein